MALEGSLTDFGLADILQLIYFQRKTGILTLSGKIDRVKLLFIEGNITGAESKRRIDDNRLGKILVKKGIIKDTDLQSVLDEQKKTGAKIGNVLIKKELVSREMVCDILSSQITETVIQLFSWKQGTYEFSTQGIPQEKDLPFSLDTQHLLMEGLRIVDEWSVIKGRIALDTLFQKKSEDSTQLSEAEQEIFGYVDGENDVSTIIDLSGKDNFEVSKTLLALLERGSIETIEPVKVISPEEAATMTGALSNVLNHVAPVAMLVSVIISVFIVLVMSSGDFFRNYRTSVKIDELRTMIETYNIEHSSYPEALDLITKTTDPWGRPFIYHLKDNLFTIASSGADGREGTDDDIF